MDLGSSTVAASRARERAPVPFELLPTRTAARRPPIAPPAWQRTGFQGAPTTMLLQRGPPTRPPHSGTKARDASAWLASLRARWSSPRPRGPRIRAAAPPGPHRGHRETAYRGPSGSLHIEVSEAALQPLPGSAQLGLARGLADAELLGDLGMAVALDRIKIEHTAVAPASGRSASSRRSVLRLRSSMRHSFTAVRRSQAGRALGSRIVGSCWNMVVIVRIMASSASASSAK